MDDLEELIGYVEAEADHTKDKNLQKELDRLFRADGRSAEFLYRRGRRTDGLTIEIEHPVPKPRRNGIREERIHNEIIVDAYGPEEQALAAGITTWRTKSSFPSRLGVSGPRWSLRSARENRSKSAAWRREIAAPRHVGVHSLARPQDVAVPLSQLTAIDADESTVEAIGDWHYWLAQGYCF